MAFQFLWIPINVWPVLGAAVAAMIIGALWYSPVGFGNAWVRLSGVSKETLEKAKKQGMGKKYAVMFASNVVMAYILAFFTFGPHATAATGALTGFLAWLGFIATVSLGMVLWEEKPFKLYLLNNGHELVTLVVMGAILGAFGAVI